MSVEGYYEKDDLTFQTWSCIELRIAWTRLPLKLPRWMRLGRRMQTLEPASHHCRNGPAQIASLQSGLKIMFSSFLGKATSMGPCLTNIAAFLFLPDPGNRRHQDPTSSDFEMKPLLPTFGENLGSLLGYSCFLMDRNSLKLATPWTALCKAK